MPAARLLFVLAVSGWLLTPAEPGHAGSACGGEAVTIVGTQSSDAIVGTDGPDVIDGQGGDDAIDGRGGDDHICGGTGNDAIDGGSGRDACDGGPGANALTNCEAEGPGGASGPGAALGSGPSRRTAGCTRSPIERSFT